MMYLNSTINKSKIPKYLNMASLILVLIPISQILEDLLVFKVGPVFFTPIKLVLLVGGFTFIKYLHPRFISSMKIGSPILRLFFLFTLVQIFSITYANGLTVSQKINYFLFNLSSLVIIYGLSKLFLKTDYRYFHNNFSLTIKYIFIFSLIFSTIQLLFNDQLLHNIGSFKGSRGSLGVVGFNYERLFLCEFLTLGYGILLLQNANKIISFKIIFLGIWVLSIIIATDSFTGILGFCCIISCLPKMKLRYMLALFLVIAINLFLVMPVVKSEIFTTEQLRVREYRIQSYFQNYKTDNWRFISTLAVISDVINNPSYFGRGYKENESYLSSFYDQYLFTKFGKEGKEKKKISTHSFFSIIYDQGVIGFLIFGMLVFSMIRNSIIFYFAKVSNHFEFMIYRLSCLLASLTILRFIFYYHTIHKWHYLVAIIFLNTSYHIYQSAKRVSNYNYPLSVKGLT